MLENIVSRCVTRSEHRIDVLNAKSIGKDHLKIFVTIEKMVHLSKRWFISEFSKDAEK